MGSLLKSLLLNRPGKPLHVEPTTAAAASSSNRAPLGACTKSCGGGSQRRSRTLTQPKYGGKACLLVDVVRCSVVVDTEEQRIAGAEARARGEQA